MNSRSDAPGRTLAQNSKPGSRVVQPPPPCSRRHRVDVPRRHGTPRSPRHQPLTRAAPHGAPNLGSRRARAMSPMRRTRSTSSTRRSPRIAALGRRSAPSTRSTRRTSSLAGASPRNTPSNASPHDMDSEDADEHDGVSGSGGEDQVEMVATISATTRCAIDASGDAVYKVDQSDAFEDGKEEHDAEEDQEGADDEDGAEISQDSCRIPAWLISPEPVEVEPPQMWHADWESWYAYFAEYTDRTKQVLPRHELMSRQQRNQRILKSKKGIEGSAELLPEGLDPYQRTYICTHGRRPRKRAGILGKRPRQHIRFTDCPFRFNLQWREKDGQWLLQVRKGTFVHNHRVSSEAYSTYPCARGIKDSEVEARVEGMLDAGAKRSKIYDYLLEHKQNVIQSDVDNLVRNHSSAVSSKNDDDATATEIAKFMAEDTRNVSTVAATANGEAGVISLASAHMRELYERFPEMLLIDSSHKTNRHNYQLLTFMAMNEFGEGVAVQHSVVESNTDWHMERSIAHFKRTHPDKTKLLRVIVVDKDLNEIKVLQIAFPEATILICHFHVIKWLKEQRSKPEYGGKISTEDGSRIDAAVHGMVYAKSENEYSAHYSEFGRLCKRIGLSAFYEYFEKNWHKTQEMWVMFYRDKLPHFRNHTNNRLENFFGKLKSSIDGTTSMASCVKELVASSRRAAKNYLHRRSRIGCNVNANYDEEMATVLRYTTHFVAKALEPQYAEGLANADSYSYDQHPDDKDVIIVRNKSVAHRLSLLDWRCDCEFAMSMLLPCRHVIAYRKHACVPGAVIPLIRVDQRWTVPAVDLKPIDQFEYTDFVSKRGNRARQRTPEERYAEAVRATRLISNELADIDDDDEFDRMVDYLMKQWRHVRKSSSRPSLTSASLPANVTTNPGPGATELAQIKREQAATSKHISSPPSDYSSSGDEDHQGDISSSPQRIKLNKKARKSGRPRKVRRLDKGDERTSRGWYKTVSAARSEAKAETLAELLVSMDKERPSLPEIQQRMSGIVTRDTGGERKKPKYKKMKNPVLNLDVFYYMPPDLLDSCMSVLPLANTPRSAITVDDDDTMADDTKPIEVVEIKNYGTYSRSQIETFKRIQNLKQNLELGLSFKKWLVEEVVPAMPVHQHDLVRQAAETVMCTYPYSKIAGLESAAEYNFSMLYRATPPTWLSDASIRALCDRLAAEFPHAYFGGMQCGQPSTHGKAKTRSRKRLIADDDVVITVKLIINKDQLACVMIPVNFYNAHWCSVIVLAEFKRIYFYDPLGQGSHTTPLEEIATNLERRALDGKGYHVRQLVNPIQFDSFSCGVFVCWSFIRHIVPDCTPNMMPSQLTKRRFELFYYILTGHADIFVSGVVTCIVAKSPENLRERHVPRNADDISEHKSSKDVAVPKNDTATTIDEIVSPAKVLIVDTVAPTENSVTYDEILGSNAEIFSPGNEDDNHLPPTQVHVDDAI